MKRLALLALTLLTPWAVAQTVGLAGMLGGRALLIVDGAPPHTVAVGEQYKGVKVLSTAGDVAEVEVAGKRQSLRVGDAPSSVGSGVVEGGTRVVLMAGSGGHFLTQGQINGRAAQMVVDTGATMVSMGEADAQRMGLDYRKGQLVRMSTANGVVPAWRLRLDTVRVGDVTVYGVDAVVSGGSMPYVLLGNSFLTRFQMTRTNEQMVLEKRN